MLDAERARLATLGAGLRRDLPELIRLRDRWFLAERREGGDGGGWPPAGFGWNLALALCLDAEPGAAAGAGASGAAFLAACDRLAAGEAILARAEVGDLALAGRDEGVVAAWATSRRRPAEWRERADFAWWGDLLLRQQAAERAALAAEPAAPPAATAPPAWPLDERDRRRGALEVARMACQQIYPPEARVGGGTFAFYGAVLARLIGRALRDLDAGAGGAVSSPIGEGALVAALAADLGAEAGAVREALALFTLDAGNAAYHGASLGVAPPPLIRLDAETLARSAAGLLREPLIFLARELRRRHAQEYHNAAHLREATFRQELYALFADRRFVRAARRVELRRAGGDARTDLDALIFDRKTGTLGIFELKAQDPFARSSGERIRQRDYFLQANRQVAAASDWLRQHGGNELLARIDGPTAKKFRVQRVRLFVLGRYLAHLSGGAEPDRRAAWGTWPQVLRLVDARPFAAGEGNPIDTLFNRLVRDNTDAATGGDEAYALALGAGRIEVFPSFSAYRAATEGGRA